MSLTSGVERGDLLDDFFKGLAAFKALRGDLAFLEVGRLDDFLGDLVFDEVGRLDDFLGDLAFLEVGRLDDFLGDLAFLEGERWTDDGIFNYS
jgi:hypothetical protein